ncbi:IPT/TIG domain-containing protein [Dictyostelium discoideum AX4]|uniref:IPT/TIG domain-containing protein n=1 Tax=Dictyostelium discoideum TaxID=44689 RepID=Q54P41_DICDI|nr:IPT/TIG domain-containing protein [Dictyostelium discoideum AX4]EAL65056.1 IPT/TIG domain-containing protein [Dictyostelium discoideum AX4]|eukprot:XP_638417.1 IPT/TIG domain-containing protein [Dictyostelium discoideum AX4]
MRKLSSFILKINVLLVLFISIASSTFTTQQINALNTISSQCGFQWTSLECGATSTSIFLANSIKCDENGDINRIDIDAVSDCGLNNVFDAFPALKILYLHNVDVKNVPITIYQHPVLEQFQSISTYNFKITTDNGLNDWTKMVSLKYLHIQPVVGTMPLLPTSLQNFYYHSDDTAATQARFPFEIFTPNLLTFYLQLQVAPISSVSLQSTLFKNSTSLQTFLLYCNGYSISFSVFYKLPSTLTTLQLFLLNFGANKTMPRIGEVSWDSLQTVTLNNLAIIGTIDPEFFYLPNLRIWYSQNNPNLIGSFTSEFGSRSKLTQLFISNTAFTGALPNDILAGGLNFLDITSTNIGGAAGGELPSSFYCLPKSVFLSTSTSFRILYDQAKFGPMGTCSPTIASITTPISSLDFSIQIRGTMLGAFIPFISISMENVNGAVPLNCQVQQFGTLISCSNPFIYGQGTLTLNVLNDVTPAPSSSISFKYNAPSIASITPVPTIGGTATIYGTNFWIATRTTTDSNNYVRLINKKGTEIECTNVKVINAYQTLTCDLPSGIDGGIFVVSVSGQDNRNQAFTFLYSPPLIKSTSTKLIPTKLESIVTIFGSNFWNDTSMVQVLVQGSIDCPVQSVNHTILTCKFPKTPFILPAGQLDVSVTVNKLSYGAISNLLTMMDPSFCPNNCGSNGYCDGDVGMCICNSNFTGADCSLSTIVSKFEFGENNATITMTPQLNDDAKTTSSMKLYLVSIIENQNEILIDQWKSIPIDQYTTLYQWYGANQKNINVTIRQNQISSSDQFISFPLNSLTYRVDYYSGSSLTVNNPQFLFEFDQYPKECQNLPIIFGNPTGSSVDTRFFTLNTYNVEYFGRFPKVAIVNGQSGNGGVTSNSVGISGLFNKMVTKVNAYDCQSASFELDLTAYSTAVVREPSINSCTSQDGSQNGNTDNKKSENGWKIGVGIGVGIGGAALIVSAFFITRQRVKLSKTQTLLEKKLKEINNNL